MYQVAERAGVSIGTVSRVLNNKGRVHPDTRQRVFGAAQALGFRPQVQARSRQVAVIAEGIGKQLHNWGYYQDVWSHTVFHLDKHDINMAVPNSLEALREMHLDGIIVVGVYPAARPILADLHQRIPVVVTDDFSKAAEAYWVIGSDHHMAGKLAAERFIKTGRKRLGFIGPSDHFALPGYKQAITEAGMECIGELFASWPEEGGFYSAVSLVARRGADAIYIPGANFESMEAVHVICNVMRLRIPHDIALIGGEIHGVSKFLPPPMTTIYEPLPDIACEATKTMVALMQGEQSPKKQILPVRLIARESA